MVISLEHQAFFLLQKKWIDLMFLLSWIRILLLHLFFSLDKNQIINTKFQPKFLLWFQFQNKRDQAVLLSFGIETTIRKFGWHLVFIIWSLVIDRSNEKNNWHLYLSVVLNNSTSTYAVSNPVVLKWSTVCMTVDFSFIEKFRKKKTKTKLVQKKYSCNSHIDTTN